MDTFKFPQSPGTPLFPLSPERVNGTRPPYSGPIPQSPAYPEFGKTTPIGSNTTKPIPVVIPTVAPFQIEARSPPKSPFRHSRNNSDAVVQGMIARFDGLSVKDWKANSEVAVKRAEIAREMAELESSKLREQVKIEEGERKKIREEARKLKRELEESRERERKVARRNDVLMEELHRQNETHSKSISVYDKEIRKVRKEAYKSSSGAIKIQEELKATRAHFKMTQANLEMEKLKGAKREQEAFTAQYQLVSAQEEHQKALEQIKVLEEERDTLKTTLKEEEVARMAAEGRIALPPPRQDDDDDLLQSPARSPIKSPRKLPQPVQRGSDSEKENVVPPRKTMLALKALQEELTLERRLRQKAVDQIDFMKMECQFQCCSCRIAEQRGQKYVHDRSCLSEMERIKKEVPVLVDTMDVDVQDITAQASPIIESIEPEQPAVLSPDTGAFENDEATDEEDETVTMRDVEQGPTKPASRRYSSFRLSGSVKHSTPDFDDSHPILKPDNVGTETEEVEERTTESPSKEVEEDEAFSEDQGENENENENEIENEDENDTNQTARATTPPTIDPPSSQLEPQTPFGIDFRTITTTTTIPMLFSPLKPTPLHGNTGLPSTPQTISHPPTYGVNDENRPPPSPFPSSVVKPDGTLDRAAALEMIRQRRGRARSMVLGQATPKKQMVEGNVRRDISAPTGVVGGKGWKQ